jgi:hypothetical protein
MTDRDSNPAGGGASRRATAAGRQPDDLPEVGEGRDGKPSTDDSESNYAAPPAIPRLQAAWVPSGNQAIQLTLTEPETVAMTPRQHQQAITALSTMIVSWLEDGGYQKLAAHDKQM